MRGYEAPDTGPSSYEVITVSALFWISFLTKNLAVVPGHLLVTVTLVITLAFLTDTVTGAGT